MHCYERLTDAAKARILQELAQEFALNNLQPISEGKRSALLLQANCPEKISEELNAAGIPTFSGQGPWHKSNVERFYKSLQH